MTQIAEISLSREAPVALVAGPCVIESETHALRMAEMIATVASKVGIPLIFKSSYDKANRTSKDSQRGVGLKEGLRILGKVRKMGIPVLTDVHEVQHAEIVSSVVDCVQIPALLSRQTDLLVEVGRHAKSVNIKKSQLAAPWDVRFAAEKVLTSGTPHVVLTERGSFFGYGDLVVDFRSIEVMRSLGYSVIFDATHSVQRPGILGSSSGGRPEHVPGLVRAAAAVGVDAVFLEVHDDPANALSDGASSLDISDLLEVALQLKAIDTLVREYLPQSIL